MTMIKTAIVGFGNIGKSVYDAVIDAPDFCLTGVVCRTVRDEYKKILGDIQIATSIDALSEKPDLAILCIPSREVPGYAEQCLLKGISTSDCFDIHTRIVETRKRLDAAAKKGNAKALTAAGWDPGSDSVVRALLLACAPKGITYTNFGSGMSMGHSVAARAIKGVSNALSMTIPLGTGIHRRMVYVELEDGFDFDDVAARLKADDYFSHDETHVIKVDDINELKDMGHGVSLTRKGVSGATDNQLFEFSMKINNPALTAQILVSAARAVLKQPAGTYTMIELPVIDMIYGDREELIQKLV